MRVAALGSAFSSRASRRSHSGKTKIRKRTSRWWGRVVVIGGITGPRNVASEERGQTTRFCQRFNGWPPRAFSGIPVTVGTLGAFLTQYLLDTGDPAGAATATTHDKHGLSDAHRTSRPPPLPHAPRRRGRRARAGCPADPGGAACRAGRAPRAAAGHRRLEGAEGRTGPGRADGAVRPGAAGRTRRGRHPLSVRLRRRRGVLLAADLLRGLRNGAALQRVPGRGRAGDSHARGRPYA